MKEIKKIDLEKMKETFQNSDNADVCTLGLQLVDELIFMQKTLNDLKKEIKKNGVVTDMCQGAYSIKRCNPAIQSYNAMIKNYNSTIKQVQELLKLTPNAESDNFDDDDLE